ncbi:MAG: replication-associated recombination protein A [Chloroflexota bacterium]|nr:replication-associated recombination protein A [Chloroflexota bacterium]
MARQPRDASLFAHEARRRSAAIEPLAARMRPRSLEEFVGQEHVLSPGSVLERAIRADAVPSMVLWGPPGAGKTTLALLIAAATRAAFASLSAVASGVADLRKAVADARERWRMEQRRTILFVDEVHRFNKAQQDVILPHVEDGTVVLIGATTENPSFEVNAPLLSRARVFKFEPLTDGQVRSLAERALTDEERGVGAANARLDEAAWELLLVVAGGDARVALNAVELASQAAQPGEDGTRRVDRALMEQVLQRRAPSYDKAGDSHYDTISAFIKSMRDSDPDAAIYWLVRMIEAGEDPLFIARRIVILAAEDVGLADPQALPVAVAAQQAVHFIGMPEGAIPLAEATVYMAAAPKSNSAYAALNAAREEVRTGREYPVPLHLRNAATGLMRRMGYGEGYRYAHDYEEHFAGQQDLPPELVGKRFYEPSGEGYEREVRERVEARRRKAQERRTQPDA